jgi:hypothetical protein
MLERDEGIIFLYDVNFNVHTLLCMYCKVIEN